MCSRVREMYVCSRIEPIQMHLYCMSDLRLTTHELQLKIGRKSVSYFTCKQDGRVTEVSACPGSS